MGADWLASVPFNLLLQITTGPACTVTRTTLDDDGVETLQLLREQVGRTTRPTMSSTLMRVVLRKFDDNRFIEQLTKWEIDISVYERATQENYPSC